MGKNLSFGVFVAENYENFGKYRVIAVIFFVVRAHVVIMSFIRPQSIDQILFEHTIMFFAGKKMSITSCWNLFHVLYNNNIMRWRNFRRKRLCGKTLLVFNATSKILFGWTTGFSVLIIASLIGIIRKFMVDKKKKTFLRFLTFTTFTVHFTRRSLQV